ncbi:MAG: ABC transporter permease [bacterium]|nr:ABC transporter permease [bacterium]
MPDWRQLVRAHLPSLSLPPEREAEIAEELAQLLEDYYADNRSDGAPQPGAPQPGATDAELAAWVRTQIPEWRDLAREIRRAKRPVASLLSDRIPRTNQRPTAAGLWKGAAMNRIRHDLRYALRLLAKNPAFTVLAVITLAVGIGLNTAVFSVVNAVLFKPLPVAAPEELASVYATMPDGFTSHEPMAFPDYEDLRDQSRSFAELTAYSFTPLVFEGDDTSELVVGELVTGNYFSTLDVPPFLGRCLTAEEDRPGDARAVAVLSHSAWKRRFGSDPDVLGKTIRLNGHPFTLIGVAPPGFFGLRRGLSPELWLPMRMRTALRAASAVDAGDATPGLDRLDDRARRWIWVMGRLAAGTTFEQAQAELRTFSARFQAEYPETNAERSFALVPASKVRILPGVDAALHTASFMVMGVVALVLLIASGNIANMLLARAIARRKEIATRLALGASRRALVRQLLIESLLLSLLGGGLGLFLALGSNAVLNSLQLPLPVDVVLGLSVDVRVFLFTLAVSTLTAVAFGLAPALEATRANLSTALVGESRAAGGSRARRRLRSALVVAQVALSMLLLICAGLSVRSMQNAHLIDPGFDPSGVAVARFAPDFQGYTPIQAEEFYRRLTAGVGALPSVRSVGLASHMPLAIGINVEAAVPEHRGATPTQEWPQIDATVVDSGYFETMRIPLLRGRTFTEQDTADTPLVAVVNEELAARFWPQEEALGKRLRVDGVEGFYEVVGVARTGKYRTLGEAPRPYLYRALAQNFDGTQMLLARFSGDPGVTLSAIRWKARELDKKIAISGLSTLEETISPSLLLPRTGALVFGLFGLLGLLLAAIGIYGVIAYTVSQRTHEIGIRMAMGARRESILFQVVWEGLALTLIGVALGLAAAALTTQALSAVLYGISATDASTFIVVPLFLLLVALVASFVPAQRAANVDPLVALRHE